MTWSEAQRARAEGIVSRYPDPRSAVMPLLYLAMLDDGHLTEAGMHEVADYTGLTAAQVQSVASFYTMYKRDRTGRYLVSVCTSISCMLLGADDVLAAVVEATATPDGETDGEGRFSVEHVECIGACGGAPAVQVNYELVEGISPDGARGLCAWLADAEPGVVRGDEMQDRFGGIRSFPWGPREAEGAVAPIPAFGPYGSAATGPGGDS